jgi:hypothetical protein
MIIIIFVTCLEKQLSEVVFMQQPLSNILGNRLVEAHICGNAPAFPRQPIWNLLGNRLVEAHVCGNAQATGTELVEIDIPFAVLP